MSLVVYVDGAPMPEPEARAFWQRFSDWMEDHRGDLAGFAKSEGFASVHPAVENGRPVLVVSKSAAQRPYASVGGGSGGRQNMGDGGPRPAARKSKKSGRRGRT